MCPLASFWSFYGNGSISLNFGPIFKIWKLAYSGLRCPSVWCQNDIPRDITSLARWCHVQLWAFCPAFWGCFRLFWGNLGLIGQNGPNRPRYQRNDLQTPSKQVETAHFGSIMGVLGPVQAKMGQIGSDTREMTPKTPQNSLKRPKTPIIGPK